MIFSHLKNSLLALALSALITNVESQAVPAVCGTSSPQCCWVVRIWQLMKKNTSVSSTSSTDCCSMAGVTCSGSSVIDINWESVGLKGSIPPSISNLTDLQILRFSRNGLSGPIPPSIRSLANLKYLYLNSNALNGTVPTLLGSMPNLLLLNLSYNPLLTGKLFVKCGLEVYYINTPISVYSDGVWASYPVGLPPPGTPKECFVIPDSITTLSQNVVTSQWRSFTLDDNGNPTLDCMYYITYYCDPNKLAKSSSYVTECKSSLNFLLQKLNSYWRNYAKFCGDGIYTGTYTLPITTTCSTATSLLKLYGLYNYVPVPPELFDSANYFLWTNPYLKG